MHEVYLTRKAQKELKKIDHTDRDRVLNAIDELQKDPFPHGSKKLTGNPIDDSDDDFWRLRVGDYRVIYTTEDDDLVVLVVRVRHRREAYR
jgi:mRNA interferase RelE/StbE